MPSTADMRSETGDLAHGGKHTPRRGVYDWNQALMDIGATICTARLPCCSRCPLGGICASRKRMTQAVVEPGSPSPECTACPQDLPGPDRRGPPEKEAGFRAEALGRVIHPDFTPHDQSVAEEPAGSTGADGLVRITRGRPCRTSGWCCMRSEAPYREVDDLRRDYAGSRPAIRARLEDFARVPKTEYLYELIYCLLTPQSSAVNAAKVVAC